MKVHRVTFVVVDFDQIGADGVRVVLESQRFPNDCMYPIVTQVESADCGEWDDSHPLNNRATQMKEIERLFGERGNA